MQESEGVCVMFSVFYGRHGLLLQSERGLGAGFTAVYLKDEIMKSELSNSRFFFCSVWKEE